MVQFYRRAQSTSPEGRFELTTTDRAMYPCDSPNTSEKDLFRNLVRFIESGSGQSKTYWDGTTHRLGSSDSYGRDVENYLDAAPTYLHKTNNNPAKL